MRSSKEGAQNIIQAVLEDQEYFKVSKDEHTIVNFYFWYNKRLGLKKQDF